MRLVDFLLEGIHNTAVTAAFQVILQPLQRDADDVAMVQPGADARLALRRSQMSCSRSTSSGHRRGGCGPRFT